MNFFFVLSLLFSFAAPPQSQPNFILFIADDISGEDIEIYGHPIIKTPVIDELCKTGMRFTNAYLTTSSCSPSRCSIITGRYPHNTGAPELHTSLPADQVRFPKILKENGYHTILSGKNHMGDVRDAFDKITEGGGPSKSEDWAQHIKDLPSNKPFFCWFASSDAHHKFVITDKAPVYKPEEVIIPPYMYDAPGIRKELAGYYHEVSRFDFYIGEVIKELKEKGVYENTVIIIMADNGRPFTRAKTRVYDSGVKTPFVVHYPKIIEDGSVSNSLVSSIDIAATVLDLAEIHIDERIQGTSFQPILQDPQTKVRDVVFAEHNWHVNQAHERMVRFGEYLYIKNSFPNRRLWCVEALSFTEEMIPANENNELTEAQNNVFRNPCPPEELFHVGKDKDQLVNLVDDPHYKKVLKKARKQLKYWTKKTGDNVPSNPTPDRGTPGYEGRNPHQEFPGKATGAEKINHKGPISLK
jgi:arylsulfatase